MNKIINIILQSEMTFAEVKILMALSTAPAMSYTSLKTTTKCGDSYFARSIKSLLSKQSPLIIKNGVSLRDSYSLNPAVFGTAIYGSENSKNKLTSTIKSGAAIPGVPPLDNVFTKRTSVEWYWSNNADVQQKFVSQDATASEILLDYYKAVKGINKFPITWGKDKDNEKSHKKLASIMVKTLWEGTMEAQPNATIDDLVKIIKHVIDYSETNCRKSFPNWTLVTAQKSLVNALGLYFRGDVVSLEKEEMISGDDYVKQVEAEKLAVAIKKAEEDLRKEKMSGDIAQISDLPAKTNFKIVAITLKNSGKISSKDAEWYDSFFGYINQEQFFKKTLNELWVEYTAKHGYPEYKVIQSVPLAAATADKGTQPEKKVLLTSSEDVLPGEVKVKEKEEKEIEKKIEKKTEEKAGRKKLW